MSRSDAPTIFSLVHFVYAALLGVVFVVVVSLPLLLVRAWLLWKILHPSYNQFEFADATLLFTHSLLYGFVIGAAGLWYSPQRHGANPFTPGDTEFAPYKDLFPFQFRHHAVAVFLASCASFVVFAVYYLRLNDDPATHFSGAETADIRSNAQIVAIVIWALYFIGRKIYWELKLLPMPEYNPSGLIRGEMTTGVGGAQARADALRRSPRGSDDASDDDQFGPTITVN